MSLQSDLLAMVEDTVRRMLPSLRGQDTALGRLASRDASGLTGTVVFDSSEIPVPVKISGVVDTRDSDRVALIRSGGFWTVVGVLSMGGMGEANRRGGPSAASTTSGTYENIGSLPTVSFTKLHSATTIRVGFSLSGFATVAGTKILVAGRITGTTAADGTAYDSGDIDVTSFLFNSVNVHAAYPYGMTRFNDIPAGQYLLTMRWRRAAGTGAGSTDTNDLYAIEVDELRRQG